MWTYFSVERAFNGHIFLQGQFLNIQQKRNKTFGHTTVELTSVEIDGEKHQYGHF